MCCLFFCKVAGNIYGKGSQREEGTVVPSKIISFPELSLVEGLCPPAQPAPDTVFIEEG